MTAILPTITPTVTPVVHTILQYKTVYLSQESHLFQLAEIVKFLGLGAGLSVIHAILNGRFNLPKEVNKVLPVLYSALVAVAVVLTDGQTNLNDWYAVFAQVLAGAVGIYALITVYNAATPAQTDTSLPTVPNP